MSDRNCQPLEQHFNYVHFDRGGSGMHGNARLKSGLSVFYHEGQGNSISI